MRSTSGHREPVVGDALCTEEMATACLTGTPHDIETDGTLGILLAPLHGFWMTNKKKQQQLTGKKEERGKLLFDKFEEKKNHYKECVCAKTRHGHGCL